jgi:hypothetical protein
MCIHYFTSLYSFTFQVYYNSQNVYKLILKYLLLLQWNSTLCINIGTNE